MPGEPSADEGHLNLSPGRPQTRFSSGVRCFCCQQSAHIGDLPLAPLAWRRKRGHDTPNTSAGGDGGSNISRAGVTRILALIHGSSDGTLRRAQDLRRALHAPHSRGLRPGTKASLALLRRMEASRVGCDGQLVDLRFVPCEVRPENVSTFTTNGDWLEKMRFCITIAIRSAHSAFTS